MIINGEFNQAIVYTDIIEDGAIDQIKALCDLEVFAGSKIRIMPDVHAGKGCVIGFTADLGEKVIPDIVGVDIGCGMLTVFLGDVEIDLAKLDDFIYHNIPNGREINQQKQYDFVEELNMLKCKRNLKDGVKQWNRGIGSLGGGNHFIEVNVDEMNNKYLVIHSGSRNVGNQVARFYQKQAIEYHSGLNNIYLQERQNIISTYKEQGRRKEIENELKRLRNAFQHEPKIPPEFCYLEGDLRIDYLHDMKICQRYAEINRDTIADRILNHLFETNEFERFHTTHNYIDFEDNIIRKGSIKSYKDELLLIPINMRDGSILGRGKGNSEWNYSAPHGAGRLMSRTTAKDTLSMDDFKKSMEGIFTTSVCESTLDESPMAYKSIDDIIAYIGDTIDIIRILKPIYNFKAK